MADNDNWSIRLRKQRGRQNESVALEKTGIALSQAV
jgi:hypothetical protein